MQRPRTLVGRSAAIWRGAPIVMLAGFAGLAGCSDTQLRPTSASHATSQWLVGGWVLKGESCDSDAGVIYRENGSWAADDMAGTWRLTRGDLFIEVTNGGEAGAPGRYRERIEMRGPNEFMARRSDGPTQILKRCPKLAAEP